MTKLALIALGFFLVYITSFVSSVSTQLQEGVFLAGILLLGIPHGAADQLIAKQTAFENKLQFSVIKFFRAYMGRLILFGFIFYFFPLTANVLFLVFSAYHFGETDLNGYISDTVIGKFLAFADGILIIAVILLFHVDELKPIYLFKHMEDLEFVGTVWFQGNQVVIFAGICLAFCGLLITHHFYSERSHRAGIIYALQLLAVLFIVSQLPIIMAFTFYFVCWHSVLSIQTIIGYLKKEELFSVTSIVWQLVKNTLIVVAGIFILALVNYLFSMDETTANYIFLALALLTVPHLQVMHHMYVNIKLQPDKLHEK